MASGHLHAFGHPISILSRDPKLRIIDLELRFCYKLNLRYRSANDARSSRWLDSVRIGWDWSTQLTNNPAISAASLLPAGGRYARGC